jgi:hypothetical protein
MRMLSTLTLLIAVVVPICYPPVQGTQAKEFTAEERAKREEVARSTATAYFEASMGADLAKVMELSGLPYALDRRRVIESEEELKKLFTGLFAQKGAQAFKPRKLEIVENRRAIERDCIPVDHVVVKVLLDDDDDDYVLYCVRMSGPPRVVGLSD